MKILKTGTFLLLLCVVAVNSAAQNNPFPLPEPDHNRPRLFADLPAKIPVDIKLLESFLDLPEGQSLALLLAKGIPFQGKVVSKSDPIDPNVKSVVIKSTNRLGAAFTFVRIRNEDGSFTYRGHVLSHKHGDAYEIQLENGQYVLTKTQFYDLINE